MAHVLVLCAHPDLRLSRVNLLLLQAARALADASNEASSDAASAPGRIEVRDLYALYPDYVIDVQAEQAAAARADLIVWQHPVHWYGMPPLMKLWLDDVLALGWAYGHATGHSEPANALRGKDLWLVLSTGGPQSAYSTQGYNRYFFDAFLPPYEQTAVLCGMRFLPPLVLHGAHGVAKAALAEHVTTYTERLRSYPQWPELADMEPCEACIVPAQDRPVVGAGVAPAEVVA